METYVTGTAPAITWHYKGTLAEILAVPGPEGSLGHPTDSTLEQVYQGGAWKDVGPGSVDSSGNTAFPGAVVAPYVVDRSQYTTGARTNPFGTTSQFPKWDPAWGEFARGVASHGIGFLGDSTFQGVKVGTLVSYGSIPWFLSQKFRDVFGAISIGQGKLVPTSVNDDAAWTLGSGWSKQSLGPSNGACLQKSSGTEPITFYFPELGIDWDTVTIYALTASGGGTFNLSINGETPVVGSCAGSGTYSYSATTATTAKASRYNSFTVAPTATGQTNWICAVRLSKNTTAGEKVLFFDNHGRGGCQTVSWNNLSGNLSGMGLFPIMGSKLVIVSMGINDAAASVSVSTYISRMQSIVTFLGASADVIVLDPFLTAPGAVDTLLDQYAAALPTLTGVAKYIPLRDDMRKLTIPRVDIYHQSPVGAKTVADLIFQKLIA